MIRARRWSNKCSIPYNTSKAKHSTGPPGLHAKVSVTSFLLTGASPRTGSFLFTIISPLRWERSRLMVFHTFSWIGSLLLNVWHRGTVWVIHYKSKGWWKQIAVASRSFEHVTRICTQIHFKSCWPDGSRSFAQVIAELKDPVIEGQGDEVALSVWFLTVVEDQTVGVIGHENHCHAELLTAITT